MSDERQVFVYKGVEYSLSASLSPEEAKAKILAHLGQTAPEAPKQEETRQPKDTTAWEDIKLGLHGATKTAAKGFTGLVAPLLPDDVAARMHRSVESGADAMEAWANPRGAEQKFGGKFVGAVGTFPAQLAAMPFTPMATGMDFLDKGESLPRAHAAAGIETVGNMFGVAAPMFGASIPMKLATTGGVNAIQDFITKSLEQGVASKEETKKAYEPTFEDAVLAGATGLPLAAIPSGKKKVDTSKLDALKKRAADVSSENIPKPATSDFEVAALAEAQKRQRNAEQVAMLESAVARNDREGQRTAYDNGQSNQTLYSGKDGVYTPDNLLVENKLREQDFTRTKQEAADAILAERQRAMEQEVAQRTALEQNAAQRARQENAPTGYAQWVENQRQDVGQQQRTEQAPLEFSTDQPPYGLADTPYQPEGALDFTSFNAEQGSLPAPSRVVPRGQRGAIDATVFEKKYGFGKSAVRGEDGKLMPLYHGTENEFKDLKESTQGGALGNGVYLAVRPEYASSYAEGTGGNVHQVYANITKPLIIKGPGDPMVNALVALGKTREQATKIVEKAYDEKGYITNEVRSLAKKAGYDGLIQYRGEKPSEVVAFNRGQVKSAISPASVKPKRVFSEAELMGDWEPEMVPTSQAGRIDLEALGLGVTEKVNKARSAAVNVMNSIKGADKIEDTSMASDAPLADILANARETKDTKAFNALEAGSASRAYKGRVPWVRDAGEYMLNAIKRSELNTRNYIIGNTGAETATRKLSNQEKFELANVLKEEMLQRKQFSSEDMAAVGFTSAQLEAYAKIREMQSAALAALNRGRELNGKPPITAEEAYMTSKWSGEIKMRVTDAQGNLAYYLAGNSKRDVLNQFKALKKEFPDMVAGDIAVVKQTFNGRDVESAYSIMADAIGRDNPEFQKIQQWYNEYQATQAHSAMGTEKHFESKGNIRGFVGDRPGYNPHKEATALLQAQMDFGKESFHWAALQDAANKLAPVFQDQHIRDNQPNNLAYLQEQLRMAAGANEGSVARAVNDSIRAVGLTPAQVFGATQTAKSWFMFQKLSMNVGYGAANLLSLPFTIPHMADIMHKVGAFNPARSVTVASMLAVPMAGAHYARHYAGIDLFKGIKDANFYREMFDYAEQNGVTSRSIVDEAPLDAGVIGRVGNFTTAAPETFIRSFAFALFADSLKQTGKLNHMDVFKEAERRTNEALGDFRETEKAPIFSRMGNVGNILNTLQTFGINYYQQANYFLRELGKGNWTPIALMMAAQFGLSGISGLPGAQTSQYAWEQIKNFLPNELWAKVGSFDPKMWALEHFGMTGVDGALSTATGVSFNSRIGAPAIEDMAQAPFGPIAEAVKQAGAVANLAMKPDDKVQQADTAMKLAPSGFTGALEIGPFREQTSTARGDGRMYYKSSDLHKRDAAYARSPEEEALRKWGFRSTKEVATRDLEWKQTQYQMEAKKRKQSFSDDYYDAVMSGNTEKAGRLDAAHINVYGKPIMDAEMKRQIEQQYMTSIERAQIGAKSLPPQELIKFSKIKKILDTYKAAQ